MKNAVAKPTATQLEAMAQLPAQELIDIFMIEPPSRSTYVKKYMQKRREERIREILSMFNKASLVKAMETLGEEEVLRRINTALRQKGLKVKFRNKHLDMIKKILSEDV